MRSVRFHLDFVSPYTYLALVQAERFAGEHAIRWEVRPVVYGAILDSTGLVGPVETTAKRAYTFRDVVRAASLLGVELVGPPAHPFRSLGALRLLAAGQDEQTALPLARLLATAAWADGRDLTDIDVLQSVATEAGLGLDVVDAITAPEVKLRLRDNTTAALEAGVFGVPTFELDGELFWGHDRLPHLAAVLDGTLSPPGTEQAEMLDRPRGIDRASVRKRG